MSSTPNAGSSGKNASISARFVGRDAAYLRLADRWFSGDWVYRRNPVFYGEGRGQSRGEQEDFLLVVNQPPPTATELFAELRWGGQVLIAHADDKVMRSVVSNFKQHAGFVIEASSRTARLGLPGVRLPGIGPRVHFLVARKIALLEQGEDTDRFTFDVSLTRMPELSEGYVVMKQVPSYRRVVTRLRSRFPEAPEAVLLERAEKLVKRVFPVFLTREAAFLQLMYRDVPEEFAGRMPRALGLERAPDGTVKKLYMSWMRLGGPKLSHLEFAQQSAELLSVLHDRVGVIHLDLRLDNMVISKKGVCILDFGSAVRVGEDLEKSPMLHSLFEEMMNTSQIQRTMGKMRDKGRLTSDVIVSAHGKVDKAVDMFYLSLQISRPISNPDMLPFIDYDPTSEVAKKIKMLTNSILRPSNPDRPHFISAGDVHKGLLKLERRMKRKSSSSSDKK